MGDLSTHFSSYEFECQCGCGFDEIAIELIEVLEGVREHFGTALNVNSGCRCTKHNASVGGTKRSQHVKGTAADIRVKGHSPSEVQAYLAETYPMSYGIGRYNSFTHIDVRGRRARW